MTQDMIPIPHTGAKPRWLEDDARVHYRSSGMYCDHRPASVFQWNTNPRDEYLLDADHWAAPVLRLGGLWTPWNPLLQGDGPPADYAGGKVMFRFSGIANKPGLPDAWKWDRRQKRNDIIGYERAEPQPACSEDGELCPACSLPAHELTQVPGCGAPLIPTSTEALLEKAVEALRRAREDFDAVILRRDTGGPYRPCDAEALDRIDTTLAEIEKELGR